MKKVLPTFIGITLALVIGLIIQNKYFSENKKPQIKPEVAGLKIKYGDNNVSLLSKQEFLKDKFLNIIENKSGTYSLALKVLDEDFEVSVNSSEKFYPASLYKVPLAIGVLKNYEDENISLTDTLTLEKQHIMGGSGTLLEAELGTEYKIIDLLTLLIKQSDNTAQEMLIPTANFNLVYKLIDKDSGVSSLQIIRIFEDINNKEYLNTEGTSILFDLLIDTSFDDRIHDGLPSNTKFAHKIGNWPKLGSWHDCGIIFDKQNVAVCVLSKNTTYEEFDKVTKDFGELISKYFNF